MPQDPQITVTANTISWPAAAALYSLFTATNLSPTTLWTRATNAPVLSNGILEVSLPVVTNGTRFYRLQTQL